VITRDSVLDWTSTEYCADSESRSGSARKHPGGSEHLQDPQRQLHSGQPDATYTVTVSNLQPIPLSSCRQAAFSLASVPNPSIHGQR
jgi:hypothetical protein